MIQSNTSVVIVLNFLFEMGLPSNTECDATINALPTRERLRNCWMKNPADSTTKDSSVPFQFMSTKHQLLSS